MGKLHAVTAKQFICFLEKQGLVHVRTSGGHYLYNRPKNQPQLMRPCVFNPKYKQVPAPHIKTNLNTLGITIEDFYECLKAC